jgi:hypothetical protein
VLHRAVLLEDGDGVRHGRELLPDRDVDADETLALLVDDRVDRDRGLPGLAVTDDQLPLATTDRDERVDRLDTGLDRRIDRLRTITPGAMRSTGRVAFVSIGPLSSSGRPSASTTRPSSADPTGTSTTRPVVLTVSPSLITRRCRDDRADRLLLEVEGQAHDPVGELEHLGGERAVEPVDLGDAVTDFDTVPTLRVSTPSRTSRWRT